MINVNKNIKRSLQVTLNGQQKGIEQTRIAMRGAWPTDSYPKAEKKFQFLKRQFNKTLRGAK